LFFSPLFALLILFLECDTLLFGTASKIGGNNSASESSNGIRDKLHGAAGRSRDGRAASSAGTAERGRGEEVEVEAELEGTQGRDQLGRSAVHRVSDAKADRGPAESERAAIVGDDTKVGWSLDDGRRSEFRGDLLQLVQWAEAKFRVDEGGAEATEYLPPLYLLSAVNPNSDGSRTCSRASIL
jgi:hypothetical protein